MNHKKSGGDLPRLKTSALLMAVENGHYDLATELLEAGADVNLQLKKGQKGGNGRVSQIGASPLFLAADRADLPYIKLLVELGADPLLVNNTGTPLLIAEGYRPGNFKPAFTTIKAIREVMASHGIEPLKEPRPEVNNYQD